LTVEPGDRVLTRTVTNAWCDRFPSGWIRRRLVPLFQHAGFRDVLASPKTLVLFRLAVADGLCRFLAIVGRRLAETQGVVDGENAERWSDGISADQCDGRLQVLSAAERMFAEFVILAVSDSRRIARDSREIDSCFMSSC
jgi:hypothetical protein